MRFWITTKKIKSTLNQKHKQCLDRLNHGLQGKESKYQLLEKAQFKATCAI